MSAGARLPDRATARLLLTAGLIDAAFVFLLLEVTGAVLDAILAEVAPGLLAGFADAASPLQSALQTGVRSAMFLLLLFAYWLFCDLVLAGHSFGRAVLMLRPQSLDGGPVGRWQMTRRCMAKVSRLGLGGLSPHARASYDRAGEIYWRSPLAPDAPGSLRNWKIEILSGSSSGRSQQLGRLSMFRDQGIVRIGRDPQWSDILLDQDELVSMKHAAIRMSRGRWQIIDNGSSNSTFLGGKAMPKKTWITLSVGQPIKIANVKLILRRGK